MLGPRYDEQVAEENRFHPSMLSNYLKSLKVKLHFLVTETLLFQCSFKCCFSVLRKKVVGGFLWDICMENLFFYLLFQVFSANPEFPKVLSYRQELCKILQLIHCVSSSNLAPLCYYSCILERCHCQNLDSPNL